METTAVPTERVHADRVHTDRVHTEVAETERPQHREYHHGRTPAAWFGSVLTLVGFILGGLGIMLGPNWPLIVAGVACIAIGAIGAWGLSIAGFGQPPRP